MTRQPTVAGALATCLGWGVRLVAIRMGAAGSPVGAADGGNVIRGGRVAEPDVLARDTGVV